MLRLRTKVTASPTIRPRSSSATSATAATSGPRAENSVTISSSPTRWPSAHAVEHLGDRAAGRRPTPAREQHGRLDLGARSTRRSSAGPTSTTSAPSPTLLDLADLLREDRAGVVAAEALGVGAVEHREADVRVEPALGVEHELGVDREPGRELEAGGLGDLAQPVERGPRPLGVDVVGGDRGDAAPVVDAGVEQHAEVVGQVGRRLQVDLGRQDQPGQGDGLEVVVGRARRRARASRCRASAGSSGRSPPARGRGGGGWRRWPRAPSMRSARDSPMPTRMPVVNGMASSPAASSVASRRSGALSGEPRWASRSALQRLEHHPLRRRRPAAGRPARRR